MAYIQKSNPFKKHDGGKEHPFGWTDQEYDRAKKEKIAQYKWYVAQYISFMQQYNDAIGIGAVSKKQQEQRQQSRGEE